MEVIWREIPNYEGLYAVSNLGTVKSLDRFVFYKMHGKTIKKRFKSKILKQRINEGYYCVTLSSSGILKTIRVHQLVAMAFFNHVPNGNTYVVDHIDNNKLNNNLNNIQILHQRLNLIKAINNRFIGTTYCKIRNKWKAQIFLNKKMKHLGYFNTQEEAHDKYINSRKKYYGIC